MKKIGELNINAKLYVIYRDDDHLCRLYRKAYLPRKSGYGYSWHKNLIMKSPSIFDCLAWLQYHENFA